MLGKKLFSKTYSNERILADLRVGNEKQQLKAETYLYEQKDFFLKNSTSTLGTNTQETIFKEAFNRFVEYCKTSSNTAILKKELMAVFQTFFKDRLLITAMQNANSLSAAKAKHEFHERLEFIFQKHSSKLSDKAVNTEVYQDLVEKLLRRFIHGGIRILATNLDAYFVTNVQFAIKNYHYHKKKNLESIDNNQDVLKLKMTDRQEYGMERIVNLFWGNTLDARLTPTLSSIEVMSKSLKGFFKEDLFKLALRRIERENHKCWQLLRYRTLSFGHIGPKETDPLHYLNLYKTMIGFGYEYDAHKSSSDISIVVRKRWNRCKARLEKYYNELNN